MGIFDKVKKETINSRLYEEKLYEAALEEFENNDINTEETRTRIGFK